MCIRDRNVLARRIELGAAEAEQDRAPVQVYARALREPVSYTHLRAHETPEHLVCRLLLEKKNEGTGAGTGAGAGTSSVFFNDTATTEIYTRSLVGSVRCV